MFDLEPGPISLEDAPPSSRILASASIAMLAADEIAALGSHDDVLQRRQIDVTTDNAPNLDGSFAATVSRAEQSIADELAAGVDGTAIDASTTGDVVQAYHGQVNTYLPPPDTPVPADFNDPPPPPALPETPAGGKPRFPPFPKGPR